MLICVSAEVFVCVCACVCVCVHRYIWRIGLKHRYISDMAHHYLIYHLNISA